MKRILSLIIFVVCLALALAVNAGQRVKYTGVSRSSSGTALSSATVSVYLGGTSTPANVYTTSSGGASVTSVTSDTSGKWTFYADMDDYSFTQTFKVTVAKSGYTTVTEDFLYNLALPTDAVGYLYSNGAGTWTWTATGGSFDESGDYSPTGTWDWSGATVSGLNATGLKLADDSTLPLPAAAPEVPSFFHIDTDGTMTFVPISDYGGIPSYGDLTTEHVAVWYNDDGTWKLKAGDLPATDNTTNGKLVKKVVDGGVHTLEDAEAGVDYAAPNADTTGTASKLPVDTATDASGEESVDSTTGQYRNYDGTRQNVFSPINSFSIVIPAPADTDDINILKAPYGMTILGIDCIVQGTTSVTGQIQECSSAGASCADLDSDITCDADGAADDGTLTDSTIATRAWLRWKTTSVSGTPTFLTVTVRYRVVAD